ncbi:MAG: hypothetical protein AAFV43_04820 [Planctomycetota bacterium]
MKARFLSACALAIASAAAAGQPTTAEAREVFATTFYQFGDVPPGDPSPTLNGVIKIDLDTGSATPFIPEVSGQQQFFTDVAVGPHDGLVYVSSIVGTISRFNATTGAFVDTFAFFPGSGMGNGVNTLTFSPEGELYTAIADNDTGDGFIALFDSAGVRQTDIATGLTFPSSITLDAAGAIYVATGGVGQPGQVNRLDPSGLTPIVGGAGEIGGGSGVVFLPAAGDYDTDFDVDTDDYTAWQNGFGGGDGPADGNGDGVVDLADYTVWRDSVGQESRLLVTDFDFNSDFMGGVTGLGNELYEHNLATGVGGRFAEIPVPIPDPLPVAPPFAWPTNFPSEALLTPEGTLLVSTLGPTQRPLNNGALLEFDLEGNLLRTIATNLPPISGIAFAPEAASVAVPEPATLVAAVGLLATLASALRRGRR